MKNNTLFRFIPLAIKQVLRHRIRTLLTVLGISVVMFLFTFIQAMQHGVSQATQASADEMSLVVYREARFCPATSRLPQNYEQQIKQIPGVQTVTPVKVRVSNCRTSLDVVTFRGVPKELFWATNQKDLTVKQGQIEDWFKRTDAALVGSSLAQRRRLTPGMTFDAAGITVYVAAIIDSDQAKDQNTAYTDLSFIQLAGVDELGIVTQFDVQVTDSTQLEPVAHAIDDLFANAQEPTKTYTKQAFVGKIANEVIQLVGFARWLGIGCLAGVLALVGNAIVLSVQSRISEHAVLQTLGFSSWQVAVLIILEAVLMALIGGLIGATAAYAISEMGAFAISVEGQSIGILTTPSLIVTGLLICGALAIAAGLMPAWQAARRPIATCFRTI